MSLQYRIRSKYRDELWVQRISLCEAVLAKSLDNWCVSGGRFPTHYLVASLLYLYSPRYDANAYSPSDVSGHLASTVQSPEMEYRMAWPRRSRDEANALIDSLSAIVSRAAEIWENQGVSAISIPDVTKAITAEILARRYVIMHHTETTSRDANHWGI